MKLQLGMALAVAVSTTAMLVPSAQASTKKDSVSASAQAFTSAQSRLLWNVTARGTCTNVSAKSDVTKITVRLYRVITEKQLVLLTSKSKAVTRTPDALSTKAVAVPVGNNVYSSVTCTYQRGGTSHIVTDGQTYKIGI